MPLLPATAPSVRRVSQITTSSDSGSKSRALLNEGEARLRPVAHQTLDRVRRAFLVFGKDDHPEQAALFRVHRRFLKLGRKHLAQAFEAVDFYFGLSREERRRIN